MVFQPFQPVFPFMGVKSLNEWHGKPFEERYLLLMAYFCDVIKVQEEPKGSNRGPWVDKFAVGAHAGLGGAWCVEAPAYCLRSVGMDPYPVVENPASVDSWRRAARAKKALSSTPKRGSLALFKTFSHGAAVAAVQGACILTIEGNTNDDGSREGYEMCRHKRLITSAEYVDLPRLFA